MKQSTKNELLVLAAVDTIKGFALKALVLIIMATAIFLCL
jgi:hypothetical protein|tara:strand:- start:278 stop:397 length:120 start_codon:yes stop_codon:yes gene_type:complete